MYHAGIFLEELWKVTKYLTHYIEISSEFFIKFWNSGQLICSSYHFALFWNNLQIVGQLKERRTSAIKLFSKQRSLISDRIIELFFIYYFVHGTRQFWRSRDSVVDIATSYGLDNRGVGVRVPVGSRIFSSSRYPDRLWGPPNLLSNR
jgi:hypothetical protein